MLGVFDTSPSTSSRSTSTTNISHISGSDGAAQLEAIAVGMFPNWAERTTKGTPFTYGDKTTGTTKFNNVQVSATAALRCDARHRCLRLRESRGVIVFCSSSPPLARQVLNSTAAGLGVKTGFSLDGAGTTVTIAAALPIGVFAGLPNLNAAAGNLATGFDLSSTALGHNKFWWENREFEASTITYVRSFREVWGGECVCGGGGGGGGGVHAVIPGGRLHLPSQRTRMRRLLFAFSSIN